MSDVYDSDIKKGTRHVVEVLNQLKPVYVHGIEGQTQGPRDFDPSFDFSVLRRKFHGTCMANNGYTLAMANQRIEEDEADLVAFGGPCIANPDLVERFRTNAALNASDPWTFYGGGARGYTDYPAIEDVSCLV